MKKRKEQNKAPDHEFFGKEVVLKEQVVIDGYEPDLLELACRMHVELSNREIEAWKISMGKKGLTTRLPIPKDVEEVISQRWRCLNLGKPFREVEEIEGETVVRRGYEHNGEKWYVTEGLE